MLRKKRFSSQFFDHHFQRLKTLDPQFTVDKELSGLSFSSIRKYARDPETVLYQLFGLEEDLFFKKSVDRQSELSFYELIPSIYPDTFASDLESKIAKISENLAFQFEHLFSYNFNQQPTRVRERIRAKDEIFTKIQSAKTDEVSLRDFEFELYNSLKGTLAYCKTINSPRYTLTAESIDTIRQSVREGTFDNQELKDAVSLFSGTSFIEYFIFDFLKEQTSLESWVALDASKTALGLYSLVQKHPKDYDHIFRTVDYASESFKNLLSSFDLVFQNNGLTGQDVETSKKLFDTLKSHENDLLYFTTIPTIYNKTDASFYGSPENVFTESFASEFLTMSPEDEEHLVSDAQVQQGKHTHLIQVGLTALKDVTLYDSLLRKSHVLEKGSFLELHHSQRYTQEGLSYLLDKEVTLDGASMYPVAIAYGSLQHTLLQNQ